MSDIGSISNLAGANPALARAAPGMRSEQPEPATVQQAVGQPLTTPQSAVIQSSNASGAEWKRPDSNGQQQNLRSSAALNRQQVTDTVERLNQRLRDYNTNLQFEVDDKYQEMVVRIVDRETQEVVRQIPSEEALALAKFFDELEAEQNQELPISGSVGNRENKKMKIEGFLLYAKV